MIKIPLSVIIFTLFISLSCQIINVPEKSQANKNTNAKVSDAKNKNTSGDTDDEPIISDTDKNQPATNPLIKAPIENFNKAATNNFIRDFPFTNFEVQNYFNPVYTTVNFLKSLQTKNLKLLLECTNENSPLLGIEIPKDSEIWWRYFAGNINSFKAIEEIFRSDKNADELYFRIRLEASVQQECILVLKKTLENHKTYWKMWNYLFDVKIQFPDALNNFGLRADEIIWTGFWQPIIFDNLSSKPKNDENLTHNSLNKIFADINNSNLDIDSCFLSKLMLETNPAELLQADFAATNEKRNQYKILLKFYSEKQIKSFQRIACYDVSSNLRIETDIVIFNSAVNKILFLRWFIFNDTPYLAEADILGKAKHHIILSLN